MKNLVKKMHCSFKTSAPTVAPWTVGELKELVCIKNENYVFSSVPQIQFEEQTHPYALRILKIQEQDQKQVVFQTTGYKTGKHSPLKMWIKDGNSSFLVENLSWEIESVLKGGEKPYPPYGPWTIGKPLWYPISWTLFFALGFFLIYRYWRYRNVKKKVQKRILEKLHGSTPLQYFISSLNPLMKKELWKDDTEYLQALCLSLREFLENRFQLPLELSTKEVIRQLGRRRDVWGKDLALQALKEVQFFLKDMSSYTKKDGEQILDMIRKFIFQYEEKASS